MQFPQECSEKKVLYTMHLAHMIKVQEALVATDWKQEKPIVLASCKSNAGDLV
jgi:hypothetical protein